ncbi:MAG TPA: orotidine-5'-phosphate decarboxylase [Stellaceae bacterium]|nr:orotidine-5'-phosphate decarboxylase [Stellaceae bacterium]
MAETPPRHAIPTRDRLIVALDVESTDEARRIAESLGDAVSFYKIGLGLLYRGGLALAGELKRHGKRVFLDAKIWDIDATMRAAVESVAALGMDFVTLHGSRSGLAEAAAGRGRSGLKLLAVTVLTSLDDSELRELGYAARVEDMVAAKARAAIAAGCDGVIASALEAAMIRGIADRMAPGFLIVTPGIRSAGAGHDEQKRVATPEGAIKAGADHVVMGRQILRAADRRAEALRVQDAIAAALR